MKTIKVKCVLLKGSWAEFTLGGIYEAEPQESYGFCVEGYYTDEDLAVEGYENECKFEVIYD